MAYCVGLEFAYFLYAEFTKRFASQSRIMRANAMTKLTKKQKREKKKKELQKARTTQEQLVSLNKNKLKNILANGRRITRRQFDAYFYSRMPLVRFTAIEVEWYSFLNNSLLGIVFQDSIDRDYGFAVMGRDGRKLFRWIDGSREFHAVRAQTREDMALLINSKYALDPQDIYPQGDEVDPNMDLFNEIVPKDKQHHGFNIIAREPRFEAGRNIINEIANSFIDNDGHFVREFQSVNFNARLWEMYLHVYLHTQGLQINNKHAAPDFEVDYFGEKYFIEAVTVNSSGNPTRPDLPPPEDLQQIAERLSDYMPIKFGSPLFSKLQHKYWEKEHVKEHPLLFAIHDYHNDNSMTWSRTALSEYLYGVKVNLVEGKATLQKIEFHEWEGKKIPSGFFNLEGAENISAVLFSNQATIPKFNRMGKIAGLGSKDVKMIRQGFLYNPDGPRPIPFSKNIDDPDYEESWSDGLIMYHNPYAIRKVNPDAFSDISHVFYSEESGFSGFHQPYDVISSLTIVVTPREDIG
jgi:hypothetical protein